MKTKLATIYNVFDGIELLIPSMNSVKSRTDLFIIVWQRKSNFGEDIGFNLPEHITGFPENTIFIEYKPNEIGGAINESAKRNAGIEVAKQNNCTHFLMMDCDEFYQTFDYAFDEYIQSGADGSVAKIITYFQKPTLRLKQFDNYYVPFIHRLHPQTKTGAKNYPFYVDPTRRVNTQNVMLITDSMHHFSYVRKDINIKIRNSSARKNILKSKLLEDYLNPNIGPGYFVKDFHQILIEVDDHFKLSAVLK